MKAKYDYKDPQLLLKIEGWARDGWENKQIAKQLNINETYLYDLINRNSELSESLKRGRRPLDIIVENSLYKRATGLKTKTITKQWIENENGEHIGELKITETEIEHPADTGAAMAWLKNRKPDHWNKQPIRIDTTTKGEEISGVTFKWGDNEIVIGGKN